MATYTELCAGAAAVALHLVADGDRSVVPLVAWMGGKRRQAAAILEHLGCTLDQVDCIHLVDAGPWGWVWSALLVDGEGPDVADVLRVWEGESPRELWQRLAERPPMPGVEGVAQWLWLQARSASGAPVWWDGWRGGPEQWHQASGASGEGPPWQTGGQWRKGRSGGGSTDAREAGWPSWRMGHPRGDSVLGQRGSWRMGEEPSKARRRDRSASQCGGGRAITDKGPDRRWTGGGIVHPATIADRIEAVLGAVARWGGAVEVSHGDVASARPEAGFCYFDPPYVGRTGYGWDCSRDAVLDVATSWGAVASTAVSEATALALPGWSHVLLRTRRKAKCQEWLTVSPGLVDVDAQLPLVVAAGGGKR